MRNTALANSELGRIIQEHDIVFVDFWAAWCAPCKEFARVYEQVANQFPDIQFVKINIEEHKQLAELFEIQSIPHLLIFKQGLVIFSEAGNLPESTLKELATQALEVDVSDIRKQLDEEGLMDAENKLDTDEWTW